MFEIKAKYYLTLLMHGTMALVGSTKSKIYKDKNGENLHQLEFTEVVLIHFHIINNSCQQLLDISPKIFIILKTFDSDFSYIEVWFTDQNSKPLEIEDKKNITLVIN